MKRDITTASTISEKAETLSHIPIVRAFDSFCAFALSKLIRANAPMTPIKI